MGIVLREPLTKMATLCSLQSTKHMPAKAPKTPRTDPHAKTPGRPMPSPKEAAKGLVQNVAILFKENHTFDNYFGTLPGANGATMAH